ncbi:MAG: putative lipid II flippase FtsW [Armatimonadetes bacterium]|nr:putative lipid II flippase FtsW [Armatimonadota bacterium]
MTAKRQMPDYPLFAVAFILTLIGVIMVFDASYVRASQKYDDVYYFLERQAIWAVLGLAVLWIASKFYYKNWQQFSVILLAVSVILLCVVMLPGVGSRANGAVRWFEFGPLKFQPSEFAKFALIVYLAHTISLRQKKMQKSLSETAVPFALILLIITLVLLGKDMGTAACLYTTVLIMLWVGGARKRHIGLLILIALLGGVALVLKEPYRLERMEAFLAPWERSQEEGFQLIHGLIAIGTGGLFGVGFGESIQKHLYLPAEHTDFIFSVYAEELGLIGTGVLLALFLTLTYRGCRIALRSKDLFARLLAAGLISMVTVQVFLNIAVNTASCPTTGVPLPFISYGGTSLLLMMASIGVLLNISLYTSKAGEAINRENRPERRGYGRARISGA